MKRQKAMALAALAALAGAAAVLLTGCVPGMREFTQEAPAGFLHGVWHGWCAPVSLVMQLLDMDVTMFAQPNTGFSYELGFYMAVISGFGSLSLMRRRKQK